MVKQFAVRNPDLLGTWVAFEPDAFGRDAGYVGRGLLGDEDGRFAVWAERLTGKLNLTAFENEPDKPWAKDDYYTLPVEKGFDGMLEPYLDSGAMMTSYVTPIERGGKRVGAVGIDLALKRPRRPHQAREGARLRLRVRGREQRPARRLPGAEGLGRQEDLAEIATQRHVTGLGGSAAARPRRGTSRRSTRSRGKPAVLFYAPVKTGGWSFVAVAPKDEMLAGVNSLRTTLILVGLLALLADRRRRWC